MTSASMSQVVIFFVIDLTAREPRRVTHKPSPYPQSVRGKIGRVVRSFVLLCLAEYQGQDENGSLPRSSG